MPQLIGYIILIFVAFAIVKGILDFVFSIFPVAIIAGIACCIYCYDKKKSDDEKQRIQEAKRIADLNEQEKAHQKKEAKRIEILIREAKELSETLGEIAKGCLIIDSNIWMNEDYDDLFKALNICCNRYKSIIYLYGPQFDEISNIKSKTQFTDERNKRARLAINRIEKLQVSGILKIRPITINSDPRAYADPLIIKLLIEESKRGINCVFISDDKELRIRVREQLASVNSDKWLIIDGDKFLKSARDITEAERHKAHSENF